MPDHTQLKESLDGGLFAYNKSQQSSLSFLKYDRFVILGTLAMPNYVWTHSVKIVVKKPWQSKLPLLRWGKFFQILWVWLGPPDNTLNQEYYVELSRSVYIQKIKMIRHVFHKILQTCYFATLSMLAKTYLKFRH